MCIKCAMLCKGETLYDLYKSSNCCRENNHPVSNRTSELKGFGRFSAAVDYINATRKINTNDIYEAKYYAQTAIKISNKFRDNLNISIKKLALNLLNEIKRGKKDSKSFTYFTLSELIIFSNKKSSGTKTEEFVIKDGIKIEENIIKMEANLTESKSRGNVIIKKSERNPNLKFTNESFDMACSPKNSNDENDNITKRTEKAQSEYILNSITYENKTDSYCKKYPLNTSLRKELELSKRAFINSETIHYPTMKNKNDEKELGNNINNISLTR